MQAAGNSQAKMAQAITQANQFLGALGTSTTAAGQTLDRFGASIDRGVVRQLETMQAGIRAANTELGQLQHFGIDATQGVTALGGAVGTVLPLLATLGVTLSLRSLVNFVTDSVILAAKMQDLNLAFKSIEGSGAAANATLSHLFDTSQRLGVNFVEIAEGFKRMDQAAKGTALEGQGIRQVFDNVLSGARVLGVSSQQAHGAIVALEQILTKGKLSAEEYRRQLGNAIPGALKLMADGFGVTTQALEQMIATGIIPGTTAVIAFGKAMGELGSGQGQGTVERLSSTFAQLKNETVAWMTTLGESIGSTLQPFLQDLIKISEEARKLLGLKSPGTQAVPGVNQRSFLGSFLPGLLSPDTLGMPAPGTTGPTELPGGRPTAALSFASSRYDELIRREAERAGIDPIIFSRLISTETGGTFDPRSTGPAIPGQGNARGLGQIMPATGADYGLTSMTDFYDPQKNVPASANILRDYTAKLKKDFGDLDDLTRIALAAYNAGIGNVEKTIRETLALGEKVTYGQVLGRLPKPEQTGPYVEKIAGAYTRPGTTSVQTPQGLMPGQPIGGTPGTAAPTSATDPLANMLLGVGKAVDETLTGIAAFQKKMDDLTASGMNFAGVLDKDITSGAEELVKKFTQAGNLLITFPGLLAKMQPQQRELVSLAAQQVAAFHQRVLDEMQSEGQARKRITEYQEFKRIQDAIDKEFEQQSTQRMQATIQDNPLFSFGLLLSPEQEAGLKEQAKAQHERLQEFARTLDIFGLTLSPGQEAERAFTKKLQDTLAVLTVPKVERTEERLRGSLAPGMTPSPAQDVLLAAITAREKALAQEREMEHLAQTLARNIQSTFDNLWEQVFSGGVDSFRSFGLLVAQSLQKTFAQFTAQLMNTLVNALSGTTDEKGGWAGALATSLVKVGVSAFGGGTASAGDAAGAIQGFRDAGFTAGVASAGGNVFMHGLGTIRALRMAEGGIVSSPAFTTIAEMGRPEAIVPLSNNRAIPVEMRGQPSPPPAPQQVVIELHQSYEGAYDPRMNRTSKKEVLSWVINDIRADGPTRRVITQHAR